jgi:hypothetical protein
MKIRFASLIKGLRELGKTEEEREGRERKRAAAHPA